MNRSEWIAVAFKLARPVLEAAAAGELHVVLKPEHHHSRRTDRAHVARLETIARLLAGISPWLGAERESAQETTQRELRSLVTAAFVTLSDSNHPDYLGFSSAEPQTVVDAAFLAHAFLRAPSLWRTLDAQVQSRLIDGLTATRRIKPYFNNWLLFSGVIEAFLFSAGAEYDPMRIDYALRQHAQWYLGDATYSDGPDFHCDYYNSFVIHPMLMDTLDQVAELDPQWAHLRELEADRFVRAAVLQERMIAPDGSWPVVGRSICYRCGAFQTLAQAALQRRLPTALPPSQVRSALSATIERTLGRPGEWKNASFREDGFLRIGLSGHQPSLGEPYITTGSLYLAATVLLPLGLSESEPFWTGQDLPWTSTRAFVLGEDIPADHAM